MLPWFDGSLVWSKYSVVDSTYKAIAVVGYLCISVRWIIYHIDTLGSCHFFLGGSLQQFSFWWQICDFCMLQWCSSFMIIFLFLFVVTSFLLSLFGEGFFPLGFLLFSDYTDCIVHGYLKWPCCWDPFSILHFAFLSFVSLRHFPKLHLRGGVRVNN